MPTPTPVPRIMKAPEKDNQASGPIAVIATSAGISPRVDELTSVQPRVYTEPREINPQNTIPVKSVTPSSVRKTPAGKNVTRKRPVR